MITFDAERLVLLISIGACLMFAFGYCLGYYIGRKEISNE